MHCCVLWVISGHCLGVGCLCWTACIWTCFGFVPYQHQIRPVQDLSLLLLRLCLQPALMDSTPISSNRLFLTVCLHPHAMLSLLPLLRSTWFCSTAHLYHSISSGSTPKFSCCCLQSAVTQLKEVRDDKVQNNGGITQEDASKIAAAEAALHDGQVPANSVSSKAQVGFQ